MDDVTTRPATADDIDRLIAILYDDPPRDLLGLVPDPRKARAVGAVFVRYGLAIDLRLTEVAVVDGEAAGLIELRRPGEDTRLTPVVTAARRRPRAGDRRAGRAVAVRALPARAEPRQHAASARCAVRR